MKKVFLPIPFSFYHSSFAVSKSFQNKRFSRESQLSIKAILKIRLFCSQATPGRRCPPFPLFALEGKAETAANDNQKFEFRPQVLIESSDFVRRLSSQLIKRTKNIIFILQKVVCVSGEPELIANFSNLFSYFILFSRVKKYDGSNVSLGRYRGIYAGRQNLHIYIVGVQ